MGIIILLDFTYVAPVKFVELLHRILKDGLGLFEYDIRLRF